MVLVGFGGTYRVTVPVKQNKPAPQLKGGLELYSKGCYERMTGASIRNLDTFIIEPKHYANPSQIKGWIRLGLD